MAANYHNEALRKQRIIERMKIARERTTLGDAVITGGNRGSFEAEISKAESCEDNRPSSTFPRIVNKNQRKAMEIQSEWRPNNLVASIERDSVHQLMHPFDFSLYDKRKSLGLRITDGAHYYKPRHKVQTHRIPYYSSYIWS